MSFINLYGCIFMVLIMLPNILFALHKESFENKYTNKFVIAFEQVGRYGCFALMTLNIPYLYAGYWFENGKTAYVVVNGILIAAYWCFWILFRNKNGFVKAVVLSVLPSAIFIFSGILLLYLPLIILSLVFAFCHVRISYKNVALEKNG